jgi:hypothetical protein
VIGLLLVEKLAMRRHGEPAPPFDSSDGAPRSHAAEKHCQDALTASGRPNSCEHPRVT